MGMINIAKNYRKYSSEELRDLAYRGLLEANGLDLSDFLEHIFQGMVSQDELDKEIEKAEKSSDELENVRESVREALAILEAIG
jgi:DNA-binding transcriptional MerR regulator